MIDFLYSIDKAVFYFCNQSLANPVFDNFMPFLTNLNQTWYGLSLFGVMWVVLMWKGGKKGRIVGILLIPLIFMGDQLSSSVIKKIFMRPRPCHEIDGAPVLDHIRLLVNCGSGFSFPSSHAVNNFAAATLLSYHYRKYMWVFLSVASIVGFSRISVGVHYPSDIVGGAIIGALCACVIIILWRIVQKPLAAFGIFDLPS